ncbi:hypothetical protein ACFY2J_31805 [Streptomyces collinus]|uniref:hypothetical protein n=1 Tax=Streptomyces collinus TaxID=42684 RepID=UPI0036AE0D9C
MSEPDKKVDRLPSRKELAVALRAFADELDKSHRLQRRPRTWARRRGPSKMGPGPAGRKRGRLGGAGPAPRREGQPSWNVASTG